MWRNPWPREVGDPADGAAATSDANPPPLPPHRVTIRQFVRLRTNTDKCFSARATHRLLLNYVSLFSFITFRLA